LVNDCGQVRLVSFKCLYLLLVLYGFGAVPMAEAIENPRVGGSIPSLATRTT
tara:strand:+ start:585 stop:740 length:156 start_codon:yes stop_codon:yes gene_type:complete